MEIADLFVINKADREGAHLLEKDLYTLLSLEEVTPEQWKPRILRSIATTGEGVEAIVEGAVDHRAWLESSPAGHAKRLRIVSQTIATLISERVTRTVLHDSEAALRTFATECVAGRIAPLEAVDRFLKTKSGKIKF